MAEHARIAQRFAILVAPGHQQPQDVIGGVLPSLGDPQPQRRRQLLARGQETRDLLLARQLRAAIQVKERHEEVAHPIDLRAGAEADQRLRRDVERDPAHLRENVHLAAQRPIGRPLRDHPRHDRQIAGHVGDREARIHHLAIAVVLRAVHVEDALAEHLADDRRPPLLVAKVSPPGMQHEAIRLRPDQIDRREITPRVAYPEDRSIPRRLRGDPGREDTRIVGGQHRDRDRVERLDRRAHRTAPLLRRGDAANDPARRPSINSR